MYVAHTRIYTISNKFEPPGINNGNQKKPETVVDIMTSEITHFFSNSNSNYLLFPIVHGPF